MMGVGMNVLLSDSAFSDSASRMDAFSSSIMDSSAGVTFPWRCLMFLLQEKEQLPGQKKLKMSMSSSYFFCLHFFCNIMSKLTKLENEAKTLKEELELCKAAKTKSEACESIHDFVENESSSKEPFTTSFEGVNEWHKKAGGDGGCVIL
ncbi:hypothetical protein ACHAXM_002270 [Skeletonema potamos]